MEGKTYKLTFTNPIDLLKKAKKIKEAVQKDNECFVGVLEKRGIKWELFNEFLMIDKSKTPEGEIQELLLSKQTTYVDEVFKELNITKNETKGL